MTVRDLIKSSLRLIGVIASGENPSSDESSDALSSLNGLIESFSNQNLLVFTKKREVFNFVASKQPHTMGPEYTETILGVPTLITPDFLTALRPVDVIGCSIKSSGTELPVKVLSHDEWIDIRTKESLTGQPTSVYLEQSERVTNLYFYPFPDQAYEVVIYSEKKIGNYTSLNDEMYLPSGFERALKYNLAMELAPEFGKEPSALIIEAARDSKAELKIKNSKAKQMISDAAFLVNRNRYNIFTGGCQ